MCHLYGQRIFVAWSLVTGHHGTSSRVFIVNCMGYNLLRPALAISRRYPVTDKHCVLSHYYGAIMHGMYIQQAFASDDLI